MEPRVRQTPLGHNGAPFLPPTAVVMELPGQTAVLQRGPFLSPHRIQGSLVSCRLREGQTVSRD